MQQDQTSTTVIVVLPDWLVSMMWLTVAIALVWMASSLFLYMRRRASNLTSASGARVQGDASPDFLKVDHKARKDAMERGEDYDKALKDREKAEAAAAAAASSSADKPVGLLARLSGLASLLFSIFSLLAAALQVITQVDKMSSTVSQTDKIGSIIAHYPVPTAVCAFVILFQLYYFFAQKKWVNATPK
jgi:hypothetical protein